MVQATIFHVALTGDDVSGCGAIALPCKSLDYVINVSQSGDTVKLNGDKFRNDNLRTLWFLSNSEESYFGRQWDWFPCTVMELNSTGTTHHCCFALKMLR